MARREHALSNQSLRYPCSSFSTPLASLFCNSQIINFIQGEFKFVLLPGNLLGAAQQSRTVVMREIEN